MNRSAELQFGTALSFRRAGISPNGSSALHCSVHGPDACAKSERGLSMITFNTGNELDLDAVIELYRASTLGERRPIDDRERMRAMLHNANLVVTAWDGSLLVGISRALSDFCYVTYLSDLAVRVSHQRKGIGKELIRRTQSAGGPETAVLLLAAPAAESYYPHVGFTHHPQTWLLPAGETVK